MSIYLDLYIIKTLEYVVLKWLYSLYNKRAFFFFFFSIVKQPAFTLKYGGPKQAGFLIWFKVTSSSIILFYILKGQDNLQVYFWRMGYWYQATLMARVSGLSSVVYIADFILTRLIRLGQFMFQIINLKLLLCRLSHHPFAVNFL